MKSYLEKLKTDKKYYLALLLIILVGISLRTYNFDSWARFNDDQARDAVLIRDVLSGTKPMPLLGPKAAGTMFKLGPMFYYFQYTAARIFGNSPDKLAFPDLFFSILTIPMLFVFLKKYFSLKESLIVTAIFSISYFAVQYSRFAWNPNSMPFFSLLFLYSILELARDGQKKKFSWSIIAGIALGIGIQLHTLFIFIVPPVFVIFFIMVLRKKSESWKMASFIILAAIFLNLPQIYSEFQSHGKNTHEFFSGISSKSSGVSSHVKYLLINGVCQIRANAMILSSFGSSGGSPDECHLAGLRLQMAEQKENLGIAGSVAVAFGFVLSVLFLAGGYLLLLLHLKNDENPSKKEFLKLMLIYAVISFLVFIPLATQITPRFFLVLEFIPFVLLGLWIKYILERFKKNGMKYVLIAAISLAILNLYSTQQSFASYRGSDPDRVSSPESVTLEEIRSMADYIIANTGSSPIVYVDDHSGASFGVIKGLSYFTDPVHIKAKRFAKKTKLDTMIPYFSIDLSKISQEKEKSYRNQLKDYDIVDSKTYGRFTIYKFGPR